MSVDWDKYSWVIRSEQRQKIIRKIDSPKSPKQLSEKLNAHLSQISHSLGNFKERNLAKIINKDATKGRLYTLTEEGEEVLEKLEEEEE